MLLRDTRPVASMNNASDSNDTSVRSHENSYSPLPFTKWRSNVCEAASQLKAHWKLCSCDKIAAVVACTLSFSGLVSLLNTLDFEVCASKWSIFGMCACHVASCHLSRRTGCRLRKAYQEPRTLA